MLDPHVAGSCVIYAADWRIKSQHSTSAILNSMKYLDMKDQKIDSRLILSLELVIHILAIDRNHVLIPHVVGG